MKTILVVMMLVACALTACEGPAGPPGEPGVAGLAGEPGAAGPAAQLTEEIRVKRLVLVDEAGKVRAALGVDDAGPGLFLFDEAGKQRADLAVIDAGPGLLLFDDGGCSSRRPLWGGIAHSPSQGAHCESEIPTARREAMRGHEPADG